MKVDLDIIISVATARSSPSVGAPAQVHGALTLSNIRALAAALNLPPPSPNCLAMQLVEYDRMMRRRAAAEALLNSLKLNNKDQNQSSEWSFTIPIMLFDFLCLTRLVFLATLVLNLPVLAQPYHCFVSEPLFYQLIMIYLPTIK